MKSIPRPIGVEVASLERDTGVEEIALATLEAAMDAAVEVPLAPFDESGPETEAAGMVDDDERTVILGVDVTPVLSVARRKLGIDRAGCGLVLPALAPTLGAGPFTLVKPSLEDDELEAIEPAVPGLCALADDADPEGAPIFSDVRVEVDS